MIYNKPIMLDVHTHTLFSGHAYNTIREMAAAAQERGLAILGITDHGPRIDNRGCSDHLLNLRAVDKASFGSLRVLLGVEANIIENDGTMDVPEPILSSLDLVIAALHGQCFPPSEDRERNTAAVEAALRNPYTVILAHPDDGRFPLDYRRVVKTAMENRVLLEINNSSLKEESFRLHGRENCIKLIEACKKYGADVIMSSDAHWDTSVGDMRLAEALLSEMDYPEEHIVNYDINLFYKYLR